MHRPHYSPPAAPVTDINNGRATMTTTAPRPSTTPFPLLLNLDIEDLLRTWNYLCVNRGFQQNPLHPTIPTEQKPVTSIVIKQTRSTSTETKRTPNLPPSPPTLTHMKHHVTTNHKKQTKFINDLQMVKKRAARKKLLFKDAKNTKGKATKFFSCYWQDNSSNNSVV